MTDDDRHPHDAALAALFRDNSNMEREALETMLHDLSPFPGYWCTSACRCGNHYHHPDAPQCGWCEEARDLTGRHVICNGLGGRITYHDPRGLVRVSHDDGEVKEYTFRVGHGYHLRGYVPGFGWEARARVTSLVILP